MIFLLFTLGRITCGLLSCSQGLAGSHRRSADKSLRDRVRWPAFPSHAARPRIAEPSETVSLVEHGRTVKKALQKVQKGLQKRTGLQDARLSDPASVIV
jgi:hypothetical protein